MLRTVETSLQRQQSCEHVSANQGRSVEPETTKEVASINTIRRGSYFVITFFPQNEPIDFAIKNPPHDILADFIPSIGSQLIMKIITGAAGSNLEDQFGRPFHVVIVIGARLAAMTRKNPQKNVRLGFVVQVHAQSGIIAPLLSRSEGAIMGQQANQIEMRSAVLSKFHRR